MCRSLAAASTGDDRGLRRPALCRGRGRGHSARSSATPFPSPTSRLAREAYGTFRHPAVAPLSQFGTSTFLLELFHGPTLAFKDVAMQLLARLMDHALAARGERTTIVVATSGDTGGAAVEAFRGRARVDLFVLFPQGRISEVQRRMMTTAPDDNVHAFAIEGTFDDCQALVKGLFNHHAFRDRVRPLRRQLDQLGAHRRAGGLLLHRRGDARRAAPQGRLHRADRQFRRRVRRAMWRQRMGLPIDRLVIATNVNDILARTLATGTYEVREVVPTSSPSMDIQVSSNFERLLFDAYGRDAEPRAGADVVARAVAGISRSRRARLRRSARCSPPAAPTSRRPRRRSAPRCARPAA